MKNRNTFVIPTVLNEKGLARCIETIYKFHNEDDVRIIIVDNSKDGYAYKYKDKVHCVVTSYRNLGYPKAVNFGIALSDTKWITVVNDDVEFIHKDWFPNILEVFDKYKNVVAIAPSSVKVYPTNPDKDYLPYKEDYTQADWDGLFVKKPGFDPNWVYDATMFYCVVFKREAFEKVGLMDEGYWPGGGGDDYDWCRRCYLSGNRVVQTLNSWIYHHWETSKNVVPLPKEDLERYRKWAIFDEKWGKDADLYGNTGPKDKPTLRISL